jgi:acyl carrier protein phosphodiesterase
MNYLAHAFLSNNNKGLLIGNFIADHLRGNDFSGFSSEIINGIHLHRRIDSFTDSHPSFKQSKRFFYNGFEKHSGILVDIYFDYFLARDFGRFSPTPLLKFSENVYKIYLEHENILPKSSSGFLNYIITNNLYSTYSSLEGIERVLFHLSSRIRHNVRLQDSIGLFQAHERELQVAFEVFFEKALAEFKDITERPF